MSRGVLLLGNSVIEPTGWLTNVAPSVVLFQPSAEPSVSKWMTGAPRVLTTVVKAPLTGAAGVMISLWLSTLALVVLLVSIRSKVAGAPLTVTSTTS